MQSYPYVLFLDANMPEVNGIQFAEALQRLKNPPAVIFVTAYSEHALEGFKVNAVDYLVKPVETDRLQQAVNRASEYITLHVKSQASRRRVPVEKGGKKILVPIDSIRDLASATITRTCKPTTTATSPPCSLAQLEKRLDGHGFFRVHRGYFGEPFACRSKSSPTLRRHAAFVVECRRRENSCFFSRRRVSSLKKALGL